VRGDVLEIQPADREFAYRLSLWGDEIERISEIDALTGEIARRPSERSTSFQASTSLHRKTGWKWR
jgi:excinuclease ABC subunit B